MTYASEGKPGAPRWGPRWAIVLTALGLGVNQLLILWSIGGVIGYLAHQPFALFGLAFSVVFGPLALASAIPSVYYLLRKRRGLFVAAMVPLALILMLFLVIVVFVAAPAGG